MSQDAFPRRLTEIDDLTRSEHFHLDSTDKCFFLGEYTARKGFSFSATNHVILNFKKSVDRRGRPEWRHKERTISEVGRAFGAAISMDWLASSTLVPIPPSRAKADPLYDDRMLRMLQSIPSARPLDIRELLFQQYTMEPAHDSATRPGPDELFQCYCIDERFCAPAPLRISVFDDVITTGSHFVAARRVLHERFPAAQIIGFFIARRVPETMDFSELFDVLDPE